MNLAVKLMQLIFLYVLLTLLTEIVLTNYEAYQLLPAAYDWAEASKLAFVRIIYNITSCNWEGIKLVQFSLYIFNDRIHYLILLLLALIVYCSFKNRSIKEPGISRAPKKSSEDYEEEKKRLTEQEVRKLEESQKYQDYLRNKGRREE